MRTSWNALKRARLYATPTKRKKRADAVTRRKRRQNQLKRAAGLKQFADVLRADQTRAEKYIGEFLMDRRRVNGFMFEAQQPMLGYIPDFLCREAMVIVEADGSTHNGREAYDWRRDQAFRSRGWTVLRFTNTEIMRNRGDVLRKILETCKHVRQIAPC